jgi:transmembrane sensor
VTESAETFEFGTPDYVAASWLIRRKEGISHREELRFVTWLEADPVNRTAYDDLSRGWEVAGEASAHPAIRTMVREALMIRPAGARRRPWIAAGIAAAIVMVVGVSYTSLRDVPSANTHKIVAVAATTPQVRILQTGTGERATVPLDDGSVVTLNTNSRLRVVFTEARRDVTLLAGQALFQVVKNRQRPFVVTAGDRQVIAVGTEFEVKLETRGVRVSLIEGIVDVRRIVPRGARVSVGIEAVTRLEAGETLLALPTGPMTVKTANVAENTRWREGRVRFDDTPLAEAVAEMNRYSKTPIVLTDPALGNIRISGAFKTGQTSTFVTAITDLFPVKAEDTGDAIRLRTGG